MNNELLNTLEQRIRQAVEEITLLRQNVAQLELQNSQLAQRNEELESAINTSMEQQKSWEQSMSDMLTNLNKLDDVQ
ncbi:cell division protein ZapB [Marinomonas agarivorans]|nr:cell division protein ZapB [Marinomonas agarivorans]